MSDPTPPGPRIALSIRWAPHTTHQRSQTPYGHTKGQKHASTPGITNPFHTCFHIHGDTPCHIKAPRSSSFSCSPQGQHIFLPTKTHISSTHTPTLLTHLYITYCAHNSGYSSSSHISIYSSLPTAVASRPPHSPLQYCTHHSDYTSSTHTSTVQYPQQ